MDMFADVLTGTPWPAAGVGALRLWDSHTSWTYLNPQRGVFDWTQLDRWLNLAAAHNVDVLYTFGVTPAWAAANPTQSCEYQPGACSPPANLADWDAFVSAIVSHSAGRIRYWELWNEPNLNEFWAGNAQVLAQMAQRAYAIIKSIDPNAVVLTPAATASNSDAGSWLNQFFSAGGGSSTDVVAFHGYLPNSETAPEQLTTVLDSINAAMAANGQSGKPVWDTEASWGTTIQLPDLDAQAAFLARSYILHWSLGIERFYWYAWNSPLWGSLWSSASSQVLKPGIAYREVAKWLVGAVFAGPCAVATDQTWTCQLSRPGGYQAEIVWNASGHSNAFIVDPRYSQYRDLDGNITAITGTTVQIGPKPILLEPFTGISLSQSVLQFQGVPVGTQAPTQSLIVTNLGISPLLIYGITATGDYSLTNGCGSSIDVGASCQVLVNFAPTAPGPRSGTLLLYDNAPGNAVSSVPVTGTGWDFSLKPENGTPPVAVNKSGTYGVDVTPIGGFTGTVAVSVTCNVSGVSSCSVTPSSVTIDGSDDGMIQVQVNSSLSARLGIYVALFALFVIALPRSGPLTALLCVVLLIVSCSGATGRSSDNSSTALPGIIVTAASQGGVRTLTLPISGQ
jgi:hypothetical protein